MIKLDTIQIASPCAADWNAMEGDSKVRFCGGCRKNVYNLSEMTRAEAEGLVNRMEGKLCVRFYTRPDGTALTADCPVGVRAVRYRRLRKFSYAAAVVLSCAGSLLSGTNAAQAATVKKAVKKPMPSHVLTGRIGPSHDAPTHTMGKPVMPKAVPPKELPPMTMGMVSQPVLMGAPMAVKPETPTKK